MIPYFNIPFEIPGDADGVDSRKRLSNGKQVCKYSQRQQEAVPRLPLVDYKSCCNMSGSICNE
eukprot:scaffold42764_cov60-Attheya_sp.AAC.1